MRRFICAAVILAVATQALVFPGRSWVRRAPEQEGFDPAKLKAAFDYAAGGLAETFCVSVHRNGYLLQDQYWGKNHYNSTNIIWSVSKAWTAAMIGTAERDGKLSTNNLMTKYIPEWAAEPRAAQIRVEEVLRHCSGRYYDVVADFVTPQTLEDQTEYAIKLPQSHAPGTVDQYNQMAYQTLQQVYERATGLSFQNGTQKEIYGPLQVESASYWQMHSFELKKPQRKPLVYGGHTTSCADLARFGHLWLNKGNWSGHRVFTEEFYNKAMSQPNYPFGPARRYGNFGAGPNVKSEGLGRNIVVFNPNNNIVLTRIGSELSTHFKPAEFIKLVNDAIKNPLLQSKEEDWVVAY